MMSTDLVARLLQRVQEVAHLVLRALPLDAARREVRREGRPHPALDERADEGVTVA